VEDVAPRALVATKLLVLPDRDSVIASLRETADPARHVAVESATHPVRFAGAGAGDGVVRIDSYLPDTVVLAAELKAPSLVVLTCSPTRMIRLARHG
jgi:hypothetical protein